MSSRVAIIPCIAVLTLIFVTFRMADKRSEDNLAKALEGFVRSEYRSANSYALAKSLADLEHLKVVQCIQLIEVGGARRTFYDTSLSDKCSRKIGLSRVVRVELLAANGLKYELTGKMDRSWSLFLAESLVYILIIFAFTLYAVYLANRNRRFLDRVELLQIENRNLAEVADQVRHDVASPLGAINLMVSSLKGVDEEVKQIILRAVHRAIDIFDDLGVADKMTISSDDMSGDQEILRGIAELVEEKHAQWGNCGYINMKVEDGNCDRRLSCDVVGLKRIVSNLLNNSMEAKVDQFPLVVELEVKANAADTCICLTDNGCGIPKEILGKIGERGFSFGKSNGHGLGLSYAHKILRSWGGRLEIKSKENIGTTVKIILPVVA